MRIEAPLIKQTVTLLPEETMQLGEHLGSSLPPNSVVALLGDLGAGKTTFIKGLVQGAAGINRSEISSPTFTYLHLYNGTQDIYHFDLYRLNNSSAFLAMGFDEYFTAGGICCIEWPERILGILPKDTLFVTLSYLEKGQRKISISKGENK